MIDKLTNTTGLSHELLALDAKNKELNAELLKVKSELLGIKSEFISIYVVLAFDDADEIRECILVKSSEAAQLLYKHLRKIWRNVVIISREIDDIPENILEEM